MNKCNGWHRSDLPPTPDELSQAKEVILAAVQKKAFPREYEALIMNRPVPLNSCLCQLSPTLQNNLICVGGRLRNANIDTGEKNPVILPKDDHISILLVRHHHAQVKHQGRHLTEGAVRAAGLCLLGGKSLINSVLHKCVTCRKLRGKNNTWQIYHHSASKPVLLLHMWAWISSDHGLLPPDVQGEDKLRAKGGL